MANTIQIKRKTSSGNPTGLAEGEFCLVEPDNTLFIQHGGSLKQLAIILEISQTAYDALSPPDANTIYLITS